MTLDDLPGLRAKLEEFAAVAVELDDLIQSYASHGIRPLDEDLMRNVKQVRHGAASELRD
jgi:hypothetical protein